MSAASPPRFFSSLPLAAGAMRLDGDEAQHLSRVLRLGPGAEVTLFDGSGREARARVVAAGRHEIDLTAGQPAEISRELAAPVRLAVSLPKGERQKVLVEKLTELGVTELVPLITRRGVAQPVSSAADRLRRHVVAACKQCGRNRLMTIGQPLDIPQLAQADTAGWFADPKATASGLEATGATSGEWFAIGPEGGFDQDETGSLKAAGWKGFSLGPSILRIETAAMAVAAIRAARILAVG